MPFYEFVCECGERVVRRAGFQQDAITCGCGLSAKRVVVNRIAFYGLPPVRGERLHDVYDDARELEFHAKRSDDPAAKPTELVAHAAKVRTEARLVKGEARFNVETGAVI